ncbi:MAG: choice-of-anchor R domain-containing protein [Tepidisphaeraceae bacterium]
MNRNRFGSAVVAVIALASVFVRASSASTGFPVVYSNLSSSAPFYDTNNGGFAIYGDDFGGSSNNVEAVSFTPSITTRFWVADLALGAMNRDPANNGIATVALCQDAGGIPGTVIESLVTAPLPNSDDPSGNPLASVMSVLQPQLNAGTTYWLEVTNSGLNSALWRTNNVGDIAPPSGFAWKTNGGSPWYQASQFIGSQWGRPAFRVIGTDAVPEPACLTMVGIALASLRRRPRSRSQP